MSEPNSLFAKVHITKVNFDRFLQSKPQPPQLDADWLQWWNSKEMYEKTELQENNIYCYKEPTNERIINYWTDDKRSLTFSDYNVENEVWHFGIIMFSENYFEMIPALAFIKSVAEYKKENPADFAIIYNHFWGDADVSAFLNFKNGNGLLNAAIHRKSEVDAQALQYAEAYLTKKYKEIARA